MQRVPWWRGARGEWYVLAQFVLFALVDLETRREESWLSEKLSGYAAYRKKVRKLVPFIY